MKKVIFGLCLLLQGCIYYDGCFHSPQLVSCVDKGKTFPLVAGYQKKETIGKTNSLQRWNDIVSCGGKRGDLNISYYPVKYKINNKYYNNMDECMFEKGYIFFENAECGTQDPKWNTGKCNL